MRKTIFAKEEYYHIYNRGVDKRDVFCCEEDYLRFIIAMHLMNNEDDGAMSRWKEFKKMNPKAKLFDFLKLSFGIRPLVVFIAYCLNPNHYHFILKQVADRGIERFMHKLGTGYTKYFNQKYDRSGSLFQGPFKSIHIDTNEYLLYLSAYVNKNDFIHGYGKKDWKYSSFLDYIGKRNGKLCNKEIILGQFASVGEYVEFSEKTSLHLKNKKEIEKYILE